MPTIASGILYIVLLWALYRLYLRAHRGSRLPYPPGPPGLPILGHLGFPPGAAWVTFREWSEEYKSDILHLHVVGSHIIVLNSMEAAIELLDKRSSIYSDRLRMVMAGELIGFDWSILLQRYGSFWRDCRKVFHQCFGPPVLKHYHSVQHRTVNQFLKSCVDSPDSVLEHLRYLTASFIIYVAYGIKVEDMNDPIVVNAEQAVARSIGSATAGRYLVDFMPFLKYIPEWFPGARFKVEARIARSYVMNTLCRPFEAVKCNMTAGTLPPDCGARLMIDEVPGAANDVSYMEDVFQKTLGSMYAAGFDTSLAVLSTFFLAMLLHPEIQREAQQSLDKICTDRLPTFADYDSLPYVHAIIKECLRWRPVTPSGVAHCSTRDDTYKGYCIPKGSIVFANSWAILQDPKTYPDPGTFNPRRFLTASSGTSGFKLNPDVLDPGEVAFGFGRRICPGRFLAYEEMWLVVASTLATLDISAKITDDGAPIMPTGEYVLSAICTPKPFPFQVKLRSAEHATLLEG